MGIKKTCTKNVHANVHQSACIKNRHHDMHENAERLSPHQYLITNDECDENPSSIISGSMQPNYASAHSHPRQPQTLIARYERPPDENPSSITSGSMQPNYASAHSHPRQPQTVIPSHTSRTHDSILATPAMNLSILSLSKSNVYLRQSNQTPNVYLRQSNVGLLPQPSSIHLLPKLWRQICWRGHRHVRELELI